MRVDRTFDDRLLTVKDATVTGIGTHATSTITYDLPEGYDTFTATGAGQTKARSYSV